MRIILLGFMGSGKSTVGEILAQQLGWPLAEMDQRILQLAGAGSITEIFDKSGEPQFRALEQQVAAGLREATSVVISTGGGVVEYPETMRHLQTGTHCSVYLQCPLATILRRLSAPEAVAQRPLAQSPSQLEERYTRREGLYREYANYVLPAADRAPLELAEKIISACTTSNLKTRLT